MLRSWSYVPTCAPRPTRTTDRSGRTHSAGLPSLAHTGSSFAAHSCSSSRAVSVVPASFATSTDVHRSAPLITTLRDRRRVCLRDASARRALHDCAEVPRSCTQNPSPPKSDARTSTFPDRRYHGTDPRHARPRSISAWTSACNRDHNPGLRGARSAFCYVGD